MDKQNEDVKGPGTIMELVDGIRDGSGYLCKVKWDKGIAESWIHKSMQWKLIISMHWCPQMYTEMYTETIDEFLTYFVVL